MATMRLVCCKATDKPQQTRSANFFAAVVLNKQGLFSCIDGSHNVQAGRAQLIIKTSMPLHIPVHDYECCWLKAVCIPFRCSAGGGLALQGPIGQGHHVKSLFMVALVVVEPHNEHRMC